MSVILRKNLLIAVSAAKLSISQCQPQNCKVEKFQTLKKKGSKNTFSRFPT